MSTAFLSAPTSLIGAVDFSQIRRFEVRGDFSSDDFLRLSIDRIEVISQADLAITKSDSPDPAVAGTDLTYTLTANNAGPGAADSVSLSDTLPAGATFVSLSAPGGWSCSTPAVGAGGAVNCSIANFVAGANSAFTLVVAVSPALANGTPISNTATVSSAATSDSDSGNNSAIATTTVTNSADLSITKTDGVTSATPGGSATYTITAANAGSSNAPGSAVADTFPASLTCTWTCVGAGGGTCTAAGSGNINDSVNLPAGASATYTASCTIAAAATGTLINTATIASGVTDPNPGNNSATDTDTIALAADIEVDKTVDNPTPNVGDTITYTVTATNDVPSDATGVQITDAVPAGLTLQTATPSQGAYTAATGVWDAGAVTTTTPATLTLAALVDQAGAITNTVTKTAGDQFDPDASNNAGGVTLTGAPSADIQVQKRVDNATPNVGDTVAFAVTVTNVGPSDATGVRITDLLPTGLALVGTPASSVGAYDPTSGLWDLGALAANASATLAIDARVEQAGAITNTATKTAQGEHDPVAANDQSGATVSGQQADVQLVKTVDNSAPLAGQNVVFTATATNNGPSDATGIIVADPLPAALPGGAGGGRASPA